MGAMASPAQAHRSSGLHRTTVTAVYAVLFVGLGPALWLTSSSADWSDPVLLGALASLTLLASFTSVRLTSGALWDADTAVALIALTVVGPLPALAVWAPPEIIRRIVRREPLVNVGQMGNIVCLGWPLLAAWGVLQLGGAEPVTVSALPLIWIAGVVLTFSNQLLAPILYQPLWNGIPLRRVLADLGAVMLSDLTMLGVGAFTAALVPAFGYVALLTFSGIMLLPRATIEFLAHARSVTRLSVSDAAAKYSQALGSALGMSRDDRKTLIAILAIAAQHDARCEQPDAQPWTPTKILMQRFTEVMSAAWMMSEWWDGSGPAHVGRDGIPLTARVASVAQAWSALTAGGGPQLSHEDALVQLRAESGTRLDPGIVDTMAEVIELERCLTPRPACEPRVYRLPLPAHWREAFALRLGRLDASGA